jgi:hypothetical protein
MIIGLNNIFTTIWFLLMLICGGLISIVSIDKGLLFGDLIFIAKFFVGLLTLITIGVTGFFLYKFRILIITKKRIISLRPFIFKIVLIEFTKIEKYEWKTWQIKATQYKTIQIWDNNQRFVSFSDFEFENFDKLVSKLPIQQDDKQRLWIAYNQAKTNVSFMTFMIIVNLAFIVIISWIALTKGSIHQSVWIFLIVSLILIYASLKRRKIYRMIIKNGTQHAV